MPIHTNGDKYICCSSCTWEGEAKDTVSSEDGEALCPNCFEFLTIEDYE